MVALNHSVHQMYVQLLTRFITLLVILTLEVSQHIGPRYHVIIPQGSAETIITGKQF